MINSKLENQVRSLFENLGSGLNLRPIVFCGISCSGKTTTKNILLERDPDVFCFSVSCATRKPRSNEKHDVDYHFISERDFLSKISNDEFLEWQKVYHRNMYGTPVTELLNAVANNKRLILDVDVVGAFNIKKILKEHCMVVYVDSGNIERNIRRLRQRGENNEQEIAERVKKFRKELAFVAEKRTEFIDCWHYNAGDSDYDLRNAVDRLTRDIEFHDHGYESKKKFQRYVT